MCVLYACLVPLEGGVSFLGAGVAVIFQTAM